MGQNRTARRVENIQHGGERHNEQNGFQAPEDGFRGNSGQGNRPSQHCEVDDIGDKPVG